MQSLRASSAYRIPILNSAKAPVATFVVLTHRIEPLHELLPDDEVEPLSARCPKRANVTVLQVGLGTPRCVLPHRQQLRFNVEGERLVCVVRHTLTFVPTHKTREGSKT